VFHIGPEYRSPKEVWEYKLCMRDFDLVAIDHEIDELVFQAKAIFLAYHLFVPTLYLPKQCHPRTKSQVKNATSVAVRAATPVNIGVAKPSIPTLVRVAKIPAAGVKPPYIQD